MQKSNIVLVPDWADQEEQLREAVRRHSCRELLQQPIEQ